MLSAMRVTDHRVGQGSPSGMRVEVDDELEAGCDRVKSLTAS